MADNLAQAKHDLAVANRVVSHEGIIDAFGHVSMRHPTRPDRYLISRSRSPEVVEASDIYEYTLDSEPVKPLPKGIRGYGELVIHGEIYKARPDVNAVAHHHGMALLPFCNVGVELMPLYHMGAQIGEQGAVLGQPRRVRRHLSAGAQARGRPLARQGARPELAGADAPARRDRRRPQPDRAGVPHHLQLPQRRASAHDPDARPAAQPAHRRRSEDGLGAQPRAAAAGARLGVLVHPAQEGRRVPEGGEDRQGSPPT